MRDPKIEFAFWSEYIAIIEENKISLIFIVADKQKARHKGWQHKTILERAYLKILDEFATKQLKLGFSGKIIVESDPQQDLYLIAAHNRIQSMGTSDETMSGGEYRQKLTSLSLVNKANLDIDIQIADTLAPIAGMIYSNNILQKKKHTSSIEKMKKMLIEKKLGNTANPSVFEVLISQ